MSAAPDTGRGCKLRQYTPWELKNMCQSAGGHMARAQQGLLGWLQPAAQRQSENQSLTNTLAGQAYNRLDAFTMENP